MNMRGAFWIIAAATVLVLASAESSKEHISADEAKASSGTGAPATIHADHELHNKQFADDAKARFHERVSKLHAESPRQSEVRKEKPSHESAPKTAKSEDVAPQNDKNAPKAAMSAPPKMAKSEDVAPKNDKDAPKAKTTNTKVMFPLDDATKVKVNAALKHFGVNKATAQRKTMADRRSDERERHAPLREDPRFKAVWEAVKNDGVSVHEAILGLVVAQFDALDEATKNKALGGANSATPKPSADPEGGSGRRTAGLDSRMTDRFAKKIEREKARMATFKDDMQKEAFVESVFRHSDLARELLK